MNLAGEMHIRQKEKFRSVRVQRQVFFGVTHLAVLTCGTNARKVMGRFLVQDFIMDDLKTPVQTVLDQALNGDEMDNFEFLLITKSWRCY